MGKKQKKILTIGEVVLDETLILNEPLVNGNKIKSDGVYYSIGGPSAVAAFFYQKMGYSVTFVTSLAKDKDGYWMMEKFRKKRINLIITFQSKTQKNIILVDKKNKSRTIIKDCLSSKLVKIDKDLIKEADLIYLDRHQTHLFDFLLTYKKKKTEIIFDPSTDASLKNLMILKQITFPIIPYEFIFNFVKDKKNGVNFRLLKKFFNQSIIVTLGQWGSVLLTTKKYYYFPSYSVDAIDVSGAGDIYRAAFGEAILNNFSLFEAIDYANKVAALSCLRIGTSEAIPSKKEIKNFSFQKNNYKLKDFFKSFSHKKNYD